jgi:hypothetical protein
MDHAILHGKPFGIPLFHSGIPFGIPLLFLKVGKPGNIVS